MQRYLKNAGFLEQPVFLQHSFCKQYIRMEAGEGLRFDFIRTF